MIGGNVLQMMKRDFPQFDLGVEVPVLRGQWDVKTKVSSVFELHKTLHLLVYGLAIHRHPIDSFETLTCGMLQKRPGLKNSALDCGGMPVPRLTNILTYPL